MTDEHLDYLKNEHQHGRMSRREFVGRAIALGASSALISSMVMGVEAYAAETPRKGSTFRLGLGGGSTTDSINPTTYTDTVMSNAGKTIFSSFLDPTADNKIDYDLVESYEAKPGATQYVLNLRKGVTFSNGKTFDADDAIYSLNLHRGDGNKSGNSADMKAVTDIKKLTANQILLTLVAPDADFPYVLTDYHMHIVPDGFTDWSKPIGSGPYIMEANEPGVRFTAKKAPNYWRSSQGRGNFDAIEMTVINDGSARMNALVSGAVDVMNRVDPKTVALLSKNSKLEIVRASGGWFPIISMMLDKPPFNNVDFRKAMKYAIDRPQVLKTLFAGYGDLGNDHPIPKNNPYHNGDLKQTAYDPDMAKSLLKKSGMDAKMLVQASDAAFNGAVDMATLFQASAQKAGAQVDVKKEPADGFWTNVWLKAPSATSYWAGRTAATQMLTVAFKANAVWNETHWNNDKFDKLLSEAKAELDPAKRKGPIFEMQAMLHDDGGAIIPIFRDWLDAHSTNVAGHTPHSSFDLDNSRITDKAWFKA